MTIRVSVSNIVLGLLLIRHERVALSGTFWQVLESLRVPFRRAGSERRSSTNCQSAESYVNRTDLAQAVLGSAKRGQ